jgi:succinate dehydrogenase / fumarate reductase flavoprotein subunit
VGELFYKNVGIVRTKTELQNAKKTIIEIKNKIPQMGVKDTSKIYNTNLIDFLEFINMIDICETVVDGALKREKSCGAHFIEDEL